MRFMRRFSSAAAASCTTGREFTNTPQQRLAALQDDDMQKTAKRLLRPR
jgi:hypothetical protein